MNDRERVQMLRRAFESIGAAFSGLHKAAIAASEKMHQSAERAALLNRSTEHYNEGLVALTGIQESLDDWLEELEQGEDDFCDECCEDYTECLCDEADEDVDDETVRSLYTQGKFIGDIMMPAKLEGGRVYSGDPLVPVGKTGELTYTFKLDPVISPFSEHLLRTSRETQQRIADAASRQFYRALLSDHGLVDNVIHDEVQLRIPPAKRGHGKEMVQEILKHSRHGHVDLYARDSTLRLS